MAIGKIHYVVIKKKVKVYLFYIHYIVKKKMQIM